jgi:hypothetical protein
LLFSSTGECAAQELVIKVAAGAKSIRVPLGEGIAGHVGAKYVQSKA